MAAAPRKENEPFGEYRARLNREQEAISRTEHGRLVWSATYGTAMVTQNGYVPFAITLKRRGQQNRERSAPSKPRLSRKGNPLSGGLPRLSGY